MLIFFLLKNRSSTSLYRDTKVYEQISNLAENGHSMVMVNLDFHFMTGIHYLWKSQQSGDRRTETGGH